MKVQANRKGQNRALTFMELFLGVLIGAILIVLIFPIFPQTHIPRTPLAKIEMSGLTTAIEAYETDYNRLPFASYPTNEDITFGVSPSELQNLHKPRRTSLVESNSELIVVLMDINYGVNTNHQLNPKQVKYLNAKMSGDLTSRGVGTDYQYRDPWGNPYVISLDANQDGLVCDAVYSNPALYPDQTNNSMVNTNGIFEKPGKAMVWSRGPDGKASIDVPAKGGVNKDNILSWE
jgi:hypothetical protein